MTTNPTWRKPSRCESSGCPEVANYGGRIRVRSTTTGTCVQFTAQEWRDLCDGIRNNEFDFDDAEATG